MISQYARLHGVTVDQEFAIKKIREEMNELSGALSDGIVPGNIDSVADEIADVIGMAFVLCDVIDLNPVDVLHENGSAKSAITVQAVLAYPSIERVRASLRLLRPRWALGMFGQCR